MTHAADGIPAFPGATGAEPGTTHPGMSLRDWFAGQALAGMVANPAMTFHKNEVMTANAYAVADAALEGRAGKRAESPFTKGLEGYSDAFYEIAALLGIGAKPYSPKEAFERDIKPRLQALLAAERGAT